MLAASCLVFLRSLFINFHLHLIGQKLATWPPLAESLGIWEDKYYRPGTLKNVESVSNTEGKSEFLHIIHFQLKVLKKKKKL